MTVNSPKYEQHTRSKGDESILSPSLSETRRIYWVNVRPGWGQNPVEARPSPSDGEGRGVRPYSIFGMTPICWSMPSVSWFEKSSTHLPFAKRLKIVPETLARLPDRGKLIKGPVCVPVAR